ncbi:heme-binding protein [Sphingoaurantiacus capsulatus]|uniref:Heme-binding protein n=1 Tax=Sphingoaurantiacus capsulatus TaxID=1771310 RepID=A0ABV7X8Q3_9SPHN
MRRARAVALLASVAFAVSSCGGGGGGSSTPAPTPSPSPSPTPTPSGGLFAAPAAEALTVADVQRIISQAAEEAAARSTPSVIAVTDRVGNVLAVFAMNGARATAKLRASRSGTNTDLEGVDVPAGAGAIAKAITGAYLSSSGNAFSTRTASMIVQEHFPPSRGTAGLESGPLFGVQFSQLPCSDLASRFAAGGGPAAFIGPKRSPLGLAADAGGFPLYKNGVVVGGIGVMADGDYGFDTEILDTDDDAEEIIATAGLTGFEAPTEIRADRVSVDGTTLRYSDATPAALRSTPASARPFATIAATLGTLAPVIGYSAGAIIAGQTYGTEGSGVRRATTAEYANSDVFVLTDGSGANRYPPRAGTDGANALTAAEVRSVLGEAFTVMSRARAQIRRPLDSRAQVSISMVDTNGNVLGLVRSPDAPIFGIDVSLQKARTAMFFSGSFAGADLLAAQRNPALATGADANVSAFVARTRTFLNDPAALTGQKAITARAIGNLARPYFPDGELGRPNGPLSRPIANWSPLSTGLQSALVFDNLAQHVGHVVSGGTSPDTPAACTFLPAPSAAGPRLRNGIQIFPGAVPVYRGTTLVGAIGVSGDGIDQDDMISFLGTHNAGVGGANVRNADPVSRSDTIVVDVNPGTARLRYVGCPFAPFLDSADQSACNGK